MGNFQSAPVFTEVEKLHTVLLSRRQGKTVVFTNGCFDILHVGHIRYLREAAALGDILITAINSDRSARTLKGEGRPVLPEKERAEIIATFGCVDYVIIFDDLTVAGLLEYLQPDIHAKGTDYTLETVPEREVVRAYGGRIAITGDPKDHSSSELFHRVRQFHKAS